MDRPSRRSVWATSIVATLMVGLLALTATRAHTQVGGGLPAFLRLQGASPGVPQSGHANITGKLLAGSVKAAATGTDRGVAATSVDGEAGFFVRGTDLGTISAYPTAIIGTNKQPGQPSVNGVLGVVDTPGNGGVAVGGICLNGGIGVFGQGLLYEGVYGTSFNAPGVHGVFSSPSNVDISAFSQPGVLGEGPGNGIIGVTKGATAAGVIGYNPSTGYGLYGVSGQGNGVYARCGGPTGIDLSGFSTPAILAESNIGNGVLGVVNTGGAGVVGYAPNGISVYGYTQDSVGVYGYATNNGTGVYGASTTGYALYADQFSASTGTAAFVSRERSIGGFAVYGWGNTSIGSPTGVAGKSDSANGWGVFSFGRTGATGTKSFVIDHPLDPENKTLLHYSTEGAEPLNAYSGNVVTDVRGYATVHLPAWFEEINKDFRYQLTVLDDGERSDFVMVKVVQEIRANQFTLRTSRPNVKVSWRVEAVRNDRFVRTYGAPVQQDKPQGQRGTYLQPELYGKGPERGATYAAEQAPALRGKGPFSGGRR